MDGGVLAMKLKSMSVEFVFIFWGALSAVGYGDEKPRGAISGTRDGSGDLQYPYVPENLDLNCKFNVEGRVDGDNKMVIHAEGSIRVNSQMVSNGNGSIDISKDNFSKAFLYDITAPDGEKVRIDLENFPFPLNHFFIISFSEAKKDLPTIMSFAANLLFESRVAGARGSALYNFENQNVFQVSVNATDPRKESDGKALDFTITCEKNNK